MTAPVDIDHLRLWIGGSESCADVVTAWLAHAFEATFDRARAFAPGEEAPLGLHWCVAAPARPASELGRDGHPKRQGFMPPVPLPRRMWAAGELSFHEPLRIGAEVVRRSTVEAVDFKEGRTGPLVFLTIEHRFSQESRLCVLERQTIVYREDPKPGAAEAEPAALPEAGGTVVASLTPDPVLLFRYSALTFNGHRIHYDEPYVREVEGYPGLVVHGPLIATLLMQAAADSRPGARLEGFTFRARSPTFAGRPLEIAIAPDGLAMALSEGRLIMTGQARFAEPR